MQMKLEAVKDINKEWNKSKGNFQKQILIAKEDLKKSIKALESFPISTLLQSGTVEKRGG